MIIVFVLLGVVIGGLILGVISARLQDSANATAYRKWQDNITRYGKLRKDD